MAAKTGAGDTAGEILLRDYPDRSSYLFAKYGGDLLENAENARLYGMCAPHWESPDDALKENRRQRPKEAAWLSVDSTTLLPAAEACLNEGDLTDEGLDALRTAVSYLNKHHQMKLRRLREYYVRKVYLESDGDRVAAESIMRRTRRKVGVAVYVLWLLTAAAFLPVLGMPLSVKILLCAASLSVSAVLKSDIGLMADHRAKALGELSKIKWRVANPAEGLNRAGRRKAAKSKAAAEHGDTALQIKGRDGFTEVHGVRVPQKALKKPLRTIRSSKRPKNKNQ